MNDDNFYVTLPANASLDLFPNNSLNDYTTKLAQRISLSSLGWEVGLAEIQYSRNWANIDRDSGVVLKCGTRTFVKFPRYDFQKFEKAEKNKFEILSQLSGEMDEEGLRGTREASLKPSPKTESEGQFVLTIYKMDDVLAFLNEQIVKQLGMPTIQFTYNHESRRISIDHKLHPDAQLCLSYSLAQFLGWRRPDNKLKESYYDVVKDKTMAVVENIQEGYNDGAWWISYVTFTSTLEVGLPAGYYTSGEEIASRMNQAMRDKIKVDKYPYFYYNENGDYMSLKFPSFIMTPDQMGNPLEIISVSLSETLVNRIGFAPNIYFDSNTAATKKLNFSEGLNSLYVYSDVVAETLVGDVMAPLLRLVRVGMGDRSNEIFTKPYYKPVARLNYETVRIYIKNEFGENIPFRSGEVSVTLHFRRRP